jgi:hypothetical protein
MHLPGQHGPRCLFEASLPGPDDNTTAQLVVAARHLVSRVPDLGVGQVCVTQSLELGTDQHSLAHGRHRSMS